MNSRHSSAADPRGKNQAQLVKLLEIVLLIAILVSISAIAYIGLVCGS